MKRSYGEHTLAAVVLSGPACVRRYCCLDRLLRGCFYPKDERVTGMEFVKKSTPLNENSAHEIP